MEFEIKPYVRANALILHTRFPVVTVARQISSLSGVSYVCPPTVKYALVIEKGELYTNEEVIANITEFLNDHLGTTPQDEPNEQEND